MTEKQFQRACIKHFGATPFVANPKKETVVADGVLYACGTLSGKPNFYEVCKVEAA